MNIETTQSPLEASQIEVPPSSFAPLNSDSNPSKIPRVEDAALDLSNLECEPGLRKQIYEYPAGPYQPILSEYPTYNSKKHPRYFQPSWFKQFSWLEYSPSNDAVFYLPCSLFNSNASSHFGSTAFTQSGFSNWKKVHDTYMNSLHNNAQRAYQIAINCLRLKSNIDVVRWLSFQGCAFRVSYDEKVEDVLESAPQNASYTSSTIQKEIWQIYANRVRNVNREEIGDRKFSIIVDEARDESKKEQMAIILRFVDKQGQNVIFDVLLQHSFDIQNIRGQCYDGVSNMRGEFYSLQALILNDCRYAYYVNYFAHRRNQIGTLQRPGETRWSSHLNSVTSLLKMYNATSTILENLKNITSNYSQRGDAHNAYNKLRSFEFIFILHMMKEVLGVTDNLCQALQRRSQDILNALSLVFTTKYLIQKLKDDGWNELLKNVISFCETWELDFPDMNAQYIVGRSHNKKEDVTVEHHYRPKFFNLQDRGRNLHGETMAWVFQASKLYCMSVLTPFLMIFTFLKSLLIHLILTRLVSRASSECAFSAMKIVKT
ncbi:hypothetical protein ES288_D13G084800v1 [Gossypium darwinii]|uniref:TTF-type domain-containing protein n=1 Tax=Gossypium darwinii TaxID=34276 RepID=A0A5D1ZX41_GOSDA|nr:hypothetical protein ES288_D13G084800v1 [Gossypium darwinii]